MRIEKCGHFLAALFNLLIPIKGKIFGEEAYF